jgi:predicted Zn-dependent peptidase
VAAGFWVGTGSRDESRRTAGASHFLEHLLFKGTDRRRASEIAEAIDAVGGDMNAFTTKEYTAFYVRVLPDDLELGLDILNDIMWAPAFRPDEIETEREVILEEILMHGDEPSDLVSELFFSALYPDHSLGWDVLGDEQTITAMERDDICGFFAEHYRPANMVVALAGAIDHDEATAAIEKRFAGPPGGNPPERHAPAAAPRPIAVVNRPTEQAHLVVGTPALDRDDPDRYAMSVLDHALGGGLSSRLFQEVREKRGLAYSVYSFRAAFAGAGALAVYAGTSPDHVHEVLGLVTHELDDLAANGVTERELEVARGHLRGTMALGLEDSGSRMSRIGRSQLVHGEAPVVDEINARIDAVTLDDVRRVSAKVLSGPRILAVVGPFDEQEFAS